MTQENEAYVGLVEAAIRREMDVLGDGRAVALASDIDGLSVDDTGAVLSMSRPSTVVLSELVEAYTEASGEVAAFVIARRLENMVDDRTELPENVARHL